MMLIAGFSKAKSEHFNDKPGSAEVLLEISIAYTQWACHGETGTIRVFIDEGTPPYDYQWDSGDTGPDIYDAPPGTYTVTVTDGDGEQVVESVTIQELPALEDVFTMQVNHVTCNGIADGEITTGFDTITGPYSYVWSNGAATADISNLEPDNYLVTITDAHGCEMDTSATITEPDTILTSVFTEPAECNGSMDGMARVEVNGGIPVDTTPEGFVYNYHWPDPSVNDDTLQYYGGTYTLTVSDANGCSVTNQFTIGQPPALYATQAGNRQICIGGEATLTSEVTGGTAPYNFYWISAETGDTLSYGNEITRAPIETTSYYFFATDANGCTSNIVNSTINVYPELNITSVVTSADSICPGEPLQVEVEVEGGNGGPYEMRLLNTNQIVASEFTIYPDHTDTYTLRLNDACSTPAVEAEFDVTVMPLPPAAFTVDKHESCPPGTFRFNEFSPDIGQSYHWDFGDDEFSFDKSPSHTYNVSGTYDVSMTATSPFGCEKKLTREDMITIRPKPEAEFYPGSSSATVLNPTIQFFNVSNGADSVYWFFGDGDSTLQSRENPVHRFDNPGEYVVRMIAENIYGCADTTQKKITIRDKHTFYAPDAFTPNNDGVNDCFRLCGHGVDPMEFEFYVYDRYGSIVYQSEKWVDDGGCDECGEGAWDGTYNGSLVKGDKLCKAGVYYWYVRYTDYAGVEHRDEGRVSLIR